VLVKNPYENFSCERVARLYEALTGTACSKTNPSRAECLCEPFWVNSEEKVE
jgi:hypothetical protein